MCNMFKECEPTKPKFQDFVFCKKLPGDGPTVTVDDVPVVNNVSVVHNVTVLDNVTVTDNVTVVDNVIVD